MKLTQISAHWWMGRTNTACFFGYTAEEVELKFKRWLEEQ